MEGNWTILYCESVDEVTECISDKVFVWPLIVDSVRTMIRENRTSVVILECRLVGEESSIWVTQSSDEVEASLIKGLKWRESREEYEECKQMLDLLEDWRRFEREKKIADSVI